MRKELGKITNVKFGHGGYQDVMLGLHFTFGNDGWGVSWSESNWDAEMIECSKNAKWTEEDRSKSYSEIMRKLSKYLKEAKVDCVSKLKGIPVECTFDGNTLKSWRILTEVI